MQNIPGLLNVSDPITVNTGNVFEEVTDYTTAGQNPLAFTRYYNSMGNTPQLNTLAVSLGTNWRSNYDRYLKISPSTVAAERPDGRVLSFTLVNGAWTSDADVDVTLTVSGTVWTLTDQDDTVETYNSVSRTYFDLVIVYGQLASIKARNGYSQTLSYGGGSFLQSVTDSYGRSLNLTSTAAGYLTSVTTPDALVLNYTVTPLSSGGSRLTSVSYSTNPATSLTYQYAVVGFPFLLSSVTDEDGHVFSSWTYDSSGRGISNQRGMGANLTSLAYNTDGSTTVTNALGVADTYKFTMLQSIPKVTSVIRAATATTAAANETFTYDSNGFLSGKTDWNGNQATYKNDAHGDPTTIIEAVATTAARTTTITYDSTWIHLPSSIRTDGVTTSFTYDANGEVLTRTLTDTTTGSKPYSTKGQTRTWTNSWSDALLASAQSPNGNTTQYGYDGTGALISTTDALGHLTKITDHTGGGLPQTIVDPNGVTTTLAYTTRLWPSSSTVSGAGGTYLTSWGYDAAGNLTKTTLPDGSFLATSYDFAHRPIQVTDALGNYTTYTLDALGDRTQTSIYKKDGTLTWQRADTFDALGRLTLDTAGAGQTTTQTFDTNGNVLSITDALSHKTVNTYDGLNRLNSSTDANGGVTAPAYDTHSRVVSVTDANGNTTSYSRDGFGDVIQQSSPDSGVAMFTYDGDANVTGKTDALGIETNQTFDALDRPLTRTYPAHTAENVTYTYDQTGTGFSFGIGRITSVTDAAGSLTRTYEECGNLASETRINGTATLVTRYTYDGANRVASMTYPDGTLITYGHDAAGYTSTVSAKPSGSSATTNLATLTHQPFGPQTGVTYGNGIAESWTYDQSYRATNITDALASVNLQNLTYGYDTANNVKSITDAVNAANSQTLGYDAINRLTSATSGTGGYGTFGWTYDKVGNRLTQVQGTQTTTYGYAAGTNRLATITQTTTQATLRLPANLNPAHRRRVQRSAITPLSPTMIASVTQAVNPIRGPSGTSFVMLGWPLIAVGFAGLIGFRNRLPHSRSLTVVSYFAVLAGGATILQACGNSLTAVAPTFSPVGGSYPGSQTITLSDTTPGAVIYFTTDGTTPTGNSNLYTAPISISSSATIEAIAIAKGYSNSPVAMAAYTISAPVAATPAFAPVQGTYTAPQSVALSTSTSGAAIYYTTNGTAPTTGSTPYSGPINVSASETISAMAVAAGYTNSAIASAAYVINIPTAATPTITPPGGIYTAAQTVTMSTPTANAAIYYTTNGTTPTAASTLYTGPIAVGSTKTIAAIAAAPGYLTSAAATASYTIHIPTASTPVFSPAAGTYTGSQTVSISSATSGAAIYYTINGTTPTSSSTLYTGPLTVSSTETISAIAVASGYMNSAVVAASYSINNPSAAAPVFSPVAGSYTASQTITISTPTSGAAIFYTTNGTAPSSSSTLYTGPVTVSSTETIAALAIASGYANSVISSATYTLNSPTAATPVITPGSGTYGAAQTIIITDATPGSAIHYTIDGTTPTASSAAYSGSISVSSAETIQAIATVPGYAVSAVAIAAYVINAPVATTPTITPSGGTYTSAQTVTILDATSGADIYYTTDGTTPTIDATKYVGPFSVSASETIEAIAIASGDTNSKVAIAAFTINIPTGNAVTVMTNANGNITSIPPANSTAPATFSYNNANRLASVIGSPIAATFVYDLSGQRYSKTDGGTPPTIYSYAEGGILISENENGTVTDYIYADGRPIALLQPGATPAANQINYVVADRLGTPQILSNSTGTTVWSTAYQPFGTTGAVNASITQNLRFPGQLADTETGFSYNLNRDYMPNLGRYLESDPIGLAAGANTYQYAGADGLANTDPSGLKEFSFTVCDDGFCATGSVGMNGGQIDYAANIGIGMGASFSFDPNDSGCHKPGTIIGPQADTQVSFSPYLNGHLSGTAGFYYGDSSLYSAYQLTMTLLEPFSFAPINMENGQVQPPLLYPIIGVGDSSYFGFGAKKFLPAQALVAQ